MTSDAQSSPLRALTIRLLERINLGFRRGFWMGSGFVFLAIGLLTIRPISRMALSTFAVALGLLLLRKHSKRRLDELKHRLRAREQEISNTLLLRASRDRYRALGESAVVVAHDLSSPLHVASFCGKMLSEKETNPDNLRYVEQLNSSLNGAIELVSSLRSVIRKSTDSTEDGCCEFVEVHHHASRLLMLEMPRTLTKNLQLNLDRKLRGLRIGVQEADLILILDALLRDRFHHFIKNSTSDPQLGIQLVASSSGFHCVEILDNADPSGSKAPATAALSDAKRIVHRIGGWMEIEPLTPANQGPLYTTRIRFGLPMAEVIAEKGDRRAAALRV